MKKKAAGRSAAVEESKLLKVPPPKELTQTQDWLTLSTLFLPQNIIPRHELRVQYQIEEWNRVVPMLQQAGRFQEIDQRGLVQLCSVFGWMKLVELQLSIDGKTSVQQTSYGANVIPHPMNADFRSLSAEYRRLLSEFFLTPKGRGKPKPPGGGGPGSKAGEKTKPDVTLKGVQALIAENMNRPIEGLDSKPAARKTATKKAARSGRK